MRTLARSWPAWAVVVAVGTISLGVVALNRGETINAAWLVFAAVCSYFLAFRFYSLFIAEQVLGLDPNRLTPAQRLNDGLDYVPTNKNVLFGHHFAAIAGAGPLVGPVLAAQMGYLPGTLWILAGVVFAGAVQDFIVLCFDAARRPLARRHDPRRDGPSRRQHRADRRAADHDHPARRPGAGRREGPGGQPLGHLRRGDDDSRSRSDGRLPALHSARPHRARCR